MTNKLSFKQLLTAGLWAAAIIDHIYKKEIKPLFPLTVFFFNGSFYRVSICYALHGSQL